MKIKLVEAHYHIVVPFMMPEAEYSAFEEYLRSLCTEVIIEEWGTHYHITLKHDDAEAIMSEVYTYLNAGPYRMCFNAETIAAIDGSIIKWEKIVSGEHKDHGSEDCPLCQMFNPNLPNTPASMRPTGCYGCPIYKDTSFSFCSATPYQEFKNFEQSETYGPPAAQKMLNYLKTLKGKCHVSS